MHFKNLEGKSEKLDCEISHRLEREMRHAWKPLPTICILKISRENPKRTILTSGGLGLLHLPPQNLLFAICYKTNIVLFNYDYCQMEVLMKREYFFYPVVSTLTFFLPCHVICFGYRCLEVRTVFLSAN